MKHITLAERCRIVHLYTIENQTLKEIAGQFPFSTRVVRRVLSEEDVPMRKATGRPETRLKRSLVWKQADEVIRFYTESKLSVRAIAKHLGVSTQPILDILQVHNVRTRTLKEARPYRRDKYGSIDTIRERVIALRQQDAKIQEIAVAMHLTTVEVYGMLEAANASIPPGQNTFM